MSIFFIQFIIISFLMILIATYKFIIIPSNDYPEIIIDMFFHFFIIFLGLYMIFLFVIRDTIENETNNSFSDLLNNSEIKSLLSKGYSNLNNDEKELIMHKLIYLQHKDTDNTVIDKINSEAEHTANIIIIIFAVCFIFVFSYYYFYQKHNINLKVIVITNLYIFAISGIIEYILMNFMIKKKLMPISPSEAINTILDSLNKNINDL